MSKKKVDIPSIKTRGDAPVPGRLKALDRSQMHAVLATQSGGEPYASLVAYALTADARGIVFATPRATRKYRNILKNPAVAMLVDTRSNTDTDYTAAESVTVVGRARPLRRGRERQRLAGTLLRKHPLLEGFVNAAGTALVLVEISRVVHVGRFQTVTEWRP
jgi:hypothetical protein